MSEQKEGESYTIPHEGWGTDLSIGEARLAASSQMRDPYHVFIVETLCDEILRLKALVDQQKK